MAIIRPRLLRLLVIFTILQSASCLAVYAQVYQKDGQNCIKSVLGGADECTPIISEPKRLPDPEPEPEPFPSPYEEAYQAGMREFSQGNYQQALNYFSQANTERPGDAYLQQQIQICKQRLTAMRYANQADTETQCHFSVWYQKEANKFWPENDHGRLQAFTNTCYAQYLGKAKAAEASGNLQEALALYRGAAAFRQDNTLQITIEDIRGKIRRQAEQAMQRSDYPAAIRELEKLCTDAHFAGESCDLLKEARRKDEAATLLSLDPNSLPVIDPKVLKNWNPPTTQYGKPRPRYGPWQEPYGIFFKKIKALPPMDSRLPATQKYNAGFEALRRNNPQGAITQFEQAFKLNPTDPRISNALSLARTIHSDQEKNRRNALTLVAQSNAIVKTSGDYAKGYQALNNALYMHPYNPYLRDAKELMGKMYKAEFESPLSHAKLPGGKVERIHAYTSEAAVLVAGGDYRSAYNCMLQAYSLAPNSSVTRAGLKQTWELYQEKQASSDAAIGLPAPATLVAPWAD
jgi:tetratricopeptide (TPR) repeat protein